MPESHFPARRRLLSGVAGALLLSACSAKRSETVASIPPPLLQPPDDTLAPTAFVTVSSATRSAQALQQAVETMLLPALAGADIARATGPFVGVIQLWSHLEPRSLAQYGLDVDGALAALADAVGGSVVPVPGRHRMQAWALHRPHTLKAVDTQQASLTLQGKPYQPLFAVGPVEYGLAPPAWEKQAHTTVLLQGRSRLEGSLVQRCETVLQRAAANLPDDLEIQLGRIGDPRDVVPEMYVCMAQR